jgi:hypothetical protein
MEIGKSVANLITDYVDHKIRNRSANVYGFALNWSTRGLIESNTWDFISDKVTHMVWLPSINALNQKS